MKVSLSTSFSTKGVDQNFNGIKLSNSSFEKVRDVVFHLNRTGFSNLGHKTMFIENTIAAKINKFKEFRANAFFNDREFGAIFLPWSKEAYLVANPDYEQFMLPVVKQLDSGASINLMI